MTIVLENKSQLDKESALRTISAEIEAINKLKESKVLGEAKRTQNDIFYLALAMAKLENKINLENIKEILAKLFLLY